MSDKRQAKLDVLIARREALRNKDFDKVDELSGTKPAPKEKGMGMVYLDIALMLFCFFSVILAPLGLLFAVTAIFKYNAVKKSRQPRTEPEG